MRKQQRSVEQSYFQRRRRPPLVSLYSSFCISAFILHCWFVFDKHNSVCLFFSWLLFFGSLMRVCRKNLTKCVCLCVHSETEWRGGRGSRRLLPGHLRGRQSHADLEEVCLPRHQCQMRAGLQHASILKTTWSRAHCWLTALHTVFSCLVSSTISSSARRSLCVWPGSRPWRTGRGRFASMAPCSGL